MKTKIIQINTSSSSFAVKDYEKDVYRGWYARVGFQLKKFYPKLEIECWAPERKYKKEKDSTVMGVRFRVFPTTLSLRNGMEISSQMLDALKQEQNRLKKDEKLILHFHEYHSWQAYVMLLNADKTKSKIFAQNHGGRSPFENLKKYKRLALFLPVLALMQLMEKLLFKKIDIFYALSDKEILYLKRIAPNSNVRFQTMGIGEEYFRKENKNAARRKLGLKKDKRYVLYIGRLKATKGIGELLDVFKEIETKEGGVELFLLGGGIDADMYKRYAKKKGITNTAFLGEIYGKKKLDYLSACDCLILPSYTEGAPVVLMEAIARNLPVVATDVGGVNKMIVDGREGKIIKVKSKDDIIKAVEDILNWKKKNIKKYAGKYRWKRIIKQTYKDYGVL